MKNILKTGLLLVLVAFFIAACSEDEIETYSGPEAINLRIQKRDSAEFSFLTVDPSIEEYIFNVEVYIQSVVQDRERIVRFGLGDRTTAERNTNFDFADQLTIHAGETSVILPVKVLKEGLVDIEGGLVADIQVLPSEDFVPGVYGKMKLSFSGDFPKNWYSSSGDVAAIPYMIGKCTKAKYQFVFDHLKTIDLVAYASWDYNPIIALRDELNKKLDQYAAANEGKRLPDDDGSDMYFSAST